MSFDLSVFLRGFAMGTADLVPGVSGGTIALITGIYDRLISAIAAIDMKTVAMVFRGDIKGAWQRVDASFLITLALGMFAAIVVLASSIDWAMKEYPLPLWSFFFGLVLASTISLAGTLRSELSGYQIVAALLGAGIAASIALGQAVTLDTSLMGFFLAGMIAICAMVLPGISGSFLLLLMGMYQPVISALVTVDLPVLTVFFAGCLIGLLVFARVLKALFARYRATTLSTLIGVLAGSLIALWPWRAVLASTTDRHGEMRAIQSVPISPTSYGETTGDPMLGLCLFALLFGVMVVVIVGKLSKPTERSAG